MEVEAREREEEDGGGGGGREEREARRALGGEGAEWEARRVD